MIVGFAGYPQAGKDTAADALELIGFTRDSLAAPLKQMAYLRHRAHYDLRVPRGILGETVCLNTTLANVVDLYGWESAKKAYHFADGSIGTDERHLEGGGALPEEGWRLGGDLGGAPEQGGRVKVYAIREALQNLGEALAHDLGPFTLLDSLLRRVSQNKHTVITDVRRLEEAEELAAMGAFLIWIDRPGLKPVNDHPLESGEARESCAIEIVNDGSKLNLRTKVLHAVGGRLLEGAA